MLRQTRQNWKIHQTQQPHVINTKAIWTDGRVKQKTQITQLKQTKLTTGRGNQQQLIQKLRAEYPHGHVHSYKTLQKITQIHNENPETPDPKILGDRK